MSVFVRQNGNICPFNTADSWVILSDIERSIKEKIERIGTPLKDWDIQINYGIKTGFNEAFIIDGAKRKELIEQDPKSDEIIRPILRGRDIKRYGYDFADLWLINTHNGIKEKGIKPINIKDYPAIKKHLDGYWKEIEKRADQGITPYNLRNCAYMEDFFKQKIVWKAVGRNLAFSLLEEGSFITAPASFITSNQNLYLLGFLCSSFAKYYILNNSDTTGAGDVMLNIQSLSSIPIPIPDKNEQITKLVQQIIDDKSKVESTIKLESKINEIVNDLYGFTKEEIAFIDSQ
ncbi:MAG: class I SAM-dependent DNA methyltransferase [Sphingobacteriales bacterium]|nr:class I SAM-dependent DNA methyltransferase [Sphingobacteriales bacterium]MBK6890632.1 class I SAM-dependent DNA methyltransferase [Sphingobacteriales bacterium]MBK7526314.1 class I SAM-dependent DNA methyltransferase [Sphingobacteriales bacterium]MBL0247095.1 class I SAM-dependent DNA methyltransferase [Sphingobacteriales bacterium]